MFVAGLFQDNSIDVGEISVAVRPDGGLGTIFAGGDEEVFGVATASTCSLIPYALYVQTR